MQQLSAQYPVWFCDVWGVIHDGHRPFATSVHGLRRHRAAGGLVILVSNSPRTAAGVARQLDAIGVAPDCRDAIVTSGDVTRGLIVADGGPSVFHLGPARDLSLFEGLNVARVALPDAHAVVCTGLFNDLTETPDDYQALLRQMKQRDLTMICANPDRIVRKGTKLLYCAGALADAYMAIGGKVLMAGKPYAPIYDLAMVEAARLAGRTVPRAEVLAIGDGPDTDIRGAAQYGLAAVLVAGGVTDAGDGLAAAAQRVKESVPGARIVATVHDLAWE